MGNKICKICGNDFYSIARNCKYCSEICRKIGAKNSQRKYERSKRGKIAKQRGKNKYRSNPAHQRTEKIYTDSYRKNRGRQRVELLRQYNLTLKQYDKMLKEQNGVCAICHHPETKKYKDRLCSLSVDHNHKTGKVRGLLCYKCNLAIGIFNHNIEFLTQAINYLKGK